MDIREGHSGTFSNLKRLKPRESFKIRFDMSATYREYIIVGPDGTIERISSDAIIENSVIKVIEARDDAGNYGWSLVYTKRPFKGHQADREAPAENTRHRFMSTMNKLLGRTSTA